VSVTRALLAAGGEAQSFERLRAATGYRAPVEDALHRMTEAGLAKTRRARRLHDRG
jgi:hypothetical protein